MLKDSGDKKITEIQVCRTPVTRIIKKALNILQGGRISDVEKKYAYDDIYHLFMIVTLEGGRKYRIEKNNRVKISDGGQDFKKGTVCQPPTRKFKPMTLNNLIRNGEKEAGPSFWRYSAHKDNCQKFIKDMLTANGIYRYNAFITQNSSELLPKGKTRFTAQLVTDTLALGERVFSGGQKRNK